MKRALALLVIVALGGWAWWKAQQPERGPQQVPQWPAVAVEAVHAIEIERQGEPRIRLERADGGWRVIAGQGKDADGHPADAAAVGQLLDDLTGMRPVRVVSRSRAHDAELGLAPSSRVHVRLIGAEGVLRELWVGSQATDLISTHVRVGADGPVVAVDRTLRWQVMRSARGWRAQADAPGAGAGKAAKAAPAGQGASGAEGAR